MKNKIILPWVLAMFCLLIPSLNNAQKKVKSATAQEPSALLKTTPKLVVGIVVDQMRYDYISRFWDGFGEGGFKRIIGQGFNCKNNHFNYAPTSTAPGHASAYSGTTPAYHGVIGNDWYDKESDKVVYCVSDSSYSSVGTTGASGQMSPHRMTVTTITDELRLHTEMKGKTIAIALKDRGAVLPGGHTANGAYWYHGGEDGNWITSSYYMATLPKWVENFNASKTAARYKQAWVPLKDIKSYVQSGVDDNLYEGLFAGESAPVFPHDLPKLWDENGKFEILRSTPFGNALTTEFALAALEAEKLGIDNITDFLAISYSSTDYVGHKYGVNSKEIQDTYLRLDLDLERLLNNLDKSVGAGEYTLFLTADHGAIDVAAYLKDQKIPADYMDWAKINQEFRQFLQFTYGTTDLIKNFSNNQFFLDHQLVKSLDLDLRQVQETLAKELLNYKGIDQTYTAYQMWQNQYTEGLPSVLQNGYNQKRSGDILVVLAPGTVTSMTGSTHGSPQIYDTHVPLLFYGKGIKRGSTSKRTEIPDIAPTLASLLGIAFPNGTTGTPIVDVLDQ